MSIDIKYSDICNQCCRDVFFLPCCRIREVPKDVMQNLKQLEKPSDRLYSLFAEALKQVNKKVRSFKETEISAVLLYKTSVKVIIRQGGHLQLEIEGNGAPIELIQRYMAESLAGNAQQAFTYLYQLVNLTYSNYYLTELGNCYEKGLGVERELKEAVKCYEHAADRGFANAQYHLGKCLCHGIGISKNLVQAYKLFMSAAEQEHANAEYEVGMCYYKAIGVERNFRHAFTYFERAGVKEHEIAQYQVGVCYFHGIGVNKDLAKSVRWMTASAKRGYGRAQSDLGASYWTGEGCKRDDKKAAYYFTLAAKQGLSRAQFNLSQCYYLGQGVTKDVSQAIHYCQLAANQGHINAIQQLMEMQLGTRTLTSSVSDCSSLSYSSPKISSPEQRSLSFQSVGKSVMIHSNSSLRSSSPSAFRKKKSSIPTSLEKKATNSLSIHRSNSEGMLSIGVLGRGLSTDFKLSLKLSGSMKKEKSFQTSRSLDEDRELWISGKKKNVAKSSESTHSSSFFSADDPSDG